VLLHELRVHQLELEMQNEELRSARGEMELALQRYTELFDFAPIGYVTLQAGDVISDINHAGTQILGRTRGAMREFKSFLLVRFATWESHLARRRCSPPAVPAGSRRQERVFPLCLDGAACKSQSARS